MSCSDCFHMHQTNDQLRAANDVLRKLNARVIKLNNELQAELERQRKGICSGWQASWENTQEEANA